MFAAIDRTIWELHPRQKRSPVIGKHKPLFRPAEIPRQGRNLRLFTEPPGPLTDKTRTVEVRQLQTSGVATEPETEVRANS